jgi:type IV secretory pathway VirB10-like protein
LHKITLDLLGGESKLKTVRNVFVLFLLGLFISIASACGTTEETGKEGQGTEENQTEKVSEKDESTSIDDGKEEKTKKEADEAKELGSEKPKKEQKDPKNKAAETKLTKTIEKENQAQKATKDPEKEKSADKKRQSKKEVDSKKKSPPSKTTTPKKSTNQKKKAQNNDAETPKNNQSAPSDTKTDKKEEQHVTVAVIIPNEVKGTGLSPTTISITDGDTVLDATLKTGVKVDYTGSGATAYIKGINGLSEFDEGPMSGWTVKVDGAIINRSAGAYPVQTNQKIEWVYTTDYTK